MAWTEFHQFYKKINGEIVMVPKSKLMGVPETAEYKAPEPEPNWRSMYESVLQKLEEEREKSSTWYRRYQTLVSAMKLLADRSCE